MKNKQLIPWFFAVGFALLFLSTFIPENSSLKNSINIPKNTLSTSETSISTMSAVPQSAEHVIVSRIIDGDTVELSGGTRVRLIGIDTPESGDCFSQESANALKSLVEGKNVSLEKDIQEKDKYGRTLAYLYIGSTFVNEQMIKGGFAKILTIPPDVKYTNVFINAQNEARENKLGLWADEVCSLSSESRSNLESTGVETSQDGCAIKGNISSSSERIYHSPGQRYYEKTQIDEGAGERWFCSEKEAEASGWRKSKV